MIRRFLFLFICMFFASMARAQTGTIVLSVTSTPLPIVVNQKCVYVVIEENSSTPGSAFTITLPGQSTGITYPAGAKFVFTAGPNGFNSGQTLGTITVASGTVAFIGIESLDTPTLPSNGRNTGGGGGDLGATYVTSASETANLPNSRQIVAGVNTTVDASTPGQIKIDAPGGGVIANPGPEPWWTDVTAPVYGGCIYDRSYLISNSFGTISTGTNTLALSAAWPGLKNGCGIWVYGAGAQVTVPAPALAASSGAYAGGTTYALGATATNGGNTFYSLANGNVGVAPLNDTTGKWFPAAIQKGPCQLLVNASPTQGVCGSTTYSYAVASKDVLGGISAAGPTITVTAAAEPSSNCTNSVHQDWNPATSYSTGQCARFYGQFYISEANANVGNTPYQNPTKWGAMLGGPNYIWISGPLAVGARGYTIWKKIGSGAWTCLADTYIQNDTGDQKFHYEDHGSEGICPAGYPSTPPATAQFDPLITTVTSGQGTTNLVLGANAVTSVTSVNTYPDNTAALDAAIAAVNADVLQAQGLNPGAAGILIPAGGFFYLSHFDPLHATAGLPNSRTIHFLIAGSIVEHSMPIFLNIKDENVEGYGGSGGATPGINPIYFADSTGFVVADLSGNPGIEGSGGSADGEYLHAFQTASHGVQLLTTGAGPSVNQYDSLRFAAAGLINPNVIIGGNNITWSLTNFIFDGPSGDFGDDSIIVDLPDGGTTNTFQIGGTTDSEIHSKAITIRSPYANPAEGGCNIQQFKVNNVFTESAVSPGYFDIDDVASTYNEGCSVNQGTVEQGGAFDPVVGVAHVYSIQGGANDIDFHGFLQNGPMQASALYNPHPTLGGGQIYLNSDLPLGNNIYGTSSPTTNLMPGGVETNGRLNAVQDESSSHPAINLLAARPYINTLTTTTGGAFAAGTYFYYASLCTTTGLTNCTPTIGLGQTSLSNYEEAFITTPLNNENLVAIVQAYPNTPCDHYNVWRGTALNMEDHYFTVACPSGLAGPVTFTDTGTAGTAGTAPQANTANLYNTDNLGGVNSISNLSIGGTGTFGSNILCSVVNTCNIGSALMPIKNLFLGPAANESASFNTSNLTGNRVQIVPDTAGTEGVVTGSPTNNDCAKITVAGGLITGITSAGVGACSGSSGTTSALSAITAATGANNIQNGDNDQVWQWAQTTNATSAFSVDESTASSATGSFLFNVHTLATSLAIPFQATTRGTANGIALSATTGILGAIGTGGINATLYKGGTASGVGSACGANNFVTALNDGAGPTCAQPAFSNLSGNITAAQMLALTSGRIYVGTAGNVPANVALSGDATMANTGAMTLASTGASAASCGDATHSCSLTVDVKGRITANSNNVITGGGNVSNVGTPATNSLAQWTGPTTIQGLTTAGGGTAPLLGAGNAGTKGDYYVYSGTNVLTETTPGIVPNHNKTCSGYTVLQADLGTPIFCSDAGAAGVTLNSPASYTTNFYFCIMAQAAGTVTVTASGNVNGAGTLVMTTKNHACLYNNGTTWDALTATGF